MRLVNLTPHDINVLADGQVICIPPSGQVARVVERPHGTGQVPVDDVQVPLILAESGHVVGLPPQEPQTLYIVSRPVALALQGQRPDLLVPDQFERDDEGQTVGCRGFAQFVYSENHLPEEGGER